MALFRELLGEALRTRRLEQQLTLRDVSAAASVSLGYISEIERGHKEASSEMLVSLCSALAISLSQVLHHVADSIEAVEAAEAAAFANAVPGPDVVASAA